MGIIPLFHEDKKLNSPNLFKTNIYVVWGIMILSNFVYLPLFSYLERVRKEKNISLNRISEIILSNLKELK